MTQRYYTQAQVRATLDAVLRTHTQADICRATGLMAQNVSSAVNGAPIYGRLLTFLGFERARMLYVRTGMKPDSGQ